MMNKILIIEDEEAIAELEKDYLEISDFEVTIENDGEKGLKLSLIHIYARITPGITTQSSKIGCSIFIMIYTPFAAGIP